MSGCEAVFLLTPHCPAGEAVLRSCARTRYARSPPWAMMAACSAGRERGPARDAARPHGRVAAEVIRDQAGQLRRGLAGLSREGFRTVHLLRSPREVAAAAIARRPLPSDLRRRGGPFDVIGDVHGCRAELEAL